MLKIINWELVKDNITNGRIIIGLSYLYQVKQFILAYGSIPDQGTKESHFPLYNPPHRGASILSSDPFTLSDHLTTNIVDAHPYEAWFIIIAPSGAKSSIRIDYCFSSSEKKTRTG